MNYNKEILEESKKTGIHPSALYHAELQRKSNEKILNKTNKIFDLTATLGVLGFVFVVIQSWFLFDQNRIMKETNKIMQQEYNYRLYKDSLLNESQKNKTINITSDTAQQPPP